MFAFSERRRATGLLGIQRRAGWEGWSNIVRVGGLNDPERHPTNLEGEVLHTHALSQTHKIETPDKIDGFNPKQPDAKTSLMLKSKRRNF